ncbi:hypothetical protein [Aliivibrio fischeri]|uniref:hypothetical protein n=1 Tax=Aliivibrio fischeri TaxID=668 RepID=UPI00080E9D21|nr:hypothetical protein [Aliivibrio fischeri]OCH40733.1 hypothetical protein A6E02_05280 [Aliivibrio fischeri]OED53353.1 hypothetical protein BEI47_05575 [Aliivibrio fischeri]
MKNLTTIATIISGIILSGNALAEDEAQAKQYVLAEFPTIKNESDSEALKQLIIDNYYNFSPETIAVLEKVTEKDISSNKLVITELEKLGKDALLHIKQEYHYI